jgi:ubiquinone/menaquinone biosynthesis C-methylase UbiE
VAITKGMSTLYNHINELNASEAFTRQSSVFDELYSNNAIIQYKRQRVREHILRYTKDHQSMLELNCGTGEDALFFAQLGFTVHATDISQGMLDSLQKKLDAYDYKEKVTVEQCSFTDLNFLKKGKTFDYVYSNFGGLNCTSDLDKVLHSLPDLVKSGGIITLVIISDFCLWESLLVFKGKFKTAFRRLFADKGRAAQIEGSFFKCWYYAPGFVKRCLQANFEFLGLEGLCTLVPPSYIENFDEKYPKSFRFLQKKEDKWKAHWPWNRIGDYYIISFRRK